MGPRRLCYALKREDELLAALLIEYGADIQSSIYGEHILTFAITKNCSIPFIEFLLSKGASVNQPAIDGQTPLHAAILLPQVPGDATAKRSLELVEMLINKGAALNAVMKLTELIPHCISLSYAENEPVGLLLIKAQAILQCHTLVDKHRYSLLQHIGVRPSQLPLYIRAKRSMFLIKMVGLRSSTQLPIMIPHSWSCL